MHMKAKSSAFSKSSQTAVLPSTRILYKYILAQDQGVHIAIMHKSALFIFLFNLLLLYFVIPVF